jgi:hypothetical protein
MKQFVGARFATRLAATACMLVMLASTAGAAGTQSGRRPKGRTTPSPPPEMAPLPTETAPAPDEEPDANAVKIAALRYLDSMRVPEVTAEYVIGAAMKVMRTEGRFVVTPSDKQVTRKGAIDLAKEGRQEYVLYVEFEVDDDAARRYGSRQDYQDRFMAAYSVYEPGTGKTALQGRFIFRAGGSVVGYGGGGMPRYPGEERLSNVLTPAQAGERIAKHVLQVLLSRPVLHPTPRRM